MTAKNHFFENTLPKVVFTKSKRDRSLFSLTVLFVCPNIVSTLVLIVPLNGALIIYALIYNCLLAVIGVQFFHLLASGMDG